jgi:hypothetical protein
MRQRLAVMISYVQPPNLAPLLPFGKLFNYCSWQTHSNEAFTLLSYLHTKANMAAFITQEIPHPLPYHYPVFLNPISFASFPLDEANDATNDG